MTAKTLRRLLKIQNQRFAVQTVAGAVSSVWIVIAAAIRIGVP